jgi:photosystem II oxygen-evolving enhancer protein 2
MFKKFLTGFLALLVTFTLQGCVAVGGGLNAFTDEIDGYRFLYPNGWIQIKVNNGPDVVFHDLIEQTENVSVVINPVPGRKSLSDLGTPSEVGEQLSKSAIAPPDSGRTAELLKAEEREANGKKYYSLEYLISLADGRQRHSIASAAISRGKLFTLNASTPQGRWDMMQPALERSIESFTVN